MGEFEDVFSGWSWEENKMFELALAIVDEQNPERWNTVAAMIGGKSAEEVERHYETLVEDLQNIESGEMDHRLEEAHLHSLSGDCDQSTYWTDEDQKLLIQLGI
ncbi:protein RADIALIS-like 3 [Magnolia sinica]|uniref:protein RADIALIS-like 3 n=1 Tax=Magnolia sinica TaxID=86752 RepID=UPI00265832E3|nr:protein RADIALIS-like 3 [Magnolia sinica]